MPPRIDALLATLGRAGAGAGKSAPASRNDGAPNAGTAAASLPLVLHVVDRLPAGSRGDGLFKLLAQMPPGRYRHVVLPLQGHAGAGARRHGDAMQVLSLNQDGALERLDSLRLFLLLRSLKPDLLHTGSVRTLLLAMAAGIRFRLPAVQAEHDKDDNALGPASLRHLLRQRLRRRMHGWLAGTPGIGQPGPLPLHGAIDSTHFHPRLAVAAAAVGPPGFLCDSAFVIGAAGDMDDVNAHAALVQAFLILVEDQDCNDRPLRLLIAGDGPCRDKCRAMLRAAGASHLAWLPGTRDDTARLMRSMDVFIVPGPAIAPLPSATSGSDTTSAAIPATAAQAGLSSSAASGTSRILEAMASGLPVVAVAAGTHPLVQPDWTGTLVGSGRPDLLADAIAGYYRIPGLARRHGQRGRRLVLTQYSLAAVAERYLALYGRLLAPRAR